MTTAETHRENAAACLQLPQNAPDDASRALYLMMAEACALSQKKKIPAASTRKGNSCEKKDRAPRGRIRLSLGDQRSEDMGGGGSSAGRVARLNNDCSGPKDVKLSAE